MEIDIIVPFYQAENHILFGFEKMLSDLILDNKLKDFRVILVNDGSKTNNHIEFINRIKNKLGKQFVFVDLKENLGKGGAIKAGVKLSTADLFFFYDIDFPFGKNALYEIYEKIKNSNSDIVISRRVPEYFKKLPIKRRFISKIVKTSVQLFSQGKIKDSQAGLKAFKKHLKHLILSTKCNSFIMDFELLLLASRKQYKIDSIFVTPNKDIEFSNFSNKVLKNEVFNMLKILFRTS